MDQGGSVMNVEHDMVGTLRRETHGHEPVVLTNMAVRRLTPVECERLQGFPDGYTQIPWRKKPVSDCPDGPRYKALGNSWAVPVVAWIGRRIHNAITMGGKH
jgi:DNA (cytosine-5)-methyltransferase 1